MTWKCKHCDWTIDSGSFHTTTEDSKKISEHINNCPVMPWRKIVEEKHRKAREEANEG